MPASFHGDGEFLWQDFFSNSVFFLSISLPFYSFSCRTPLLVAVVLLGQHFLWLFPFSQPLLTCSATFSPTSRTCKHLSPFSFELRELKRRSDLARETPCKIREILCMVSRIWAPVSKSAPCSWGNLLSPTLPSCFLITQSPLLLLSWPVAPPTPITHFHFFIALSVFPACSPSPDTCSSLECFSSAYFFCICLAEVMSVSALCVCVYFLMLIFFFRSGEPRGEQELRFYLFWKRYSYSLLTWFKGLCHLCPAIWCCSHKHLGSLL